MIFLSYITNILEVCLSFSRLHYYFYCLRLFFFPTPLSFSSDLSFTLYSTVSTLVYVLLKLFMFT